MRACRHFYMKAVIAFVILSLFILYFLFQPSVERTLHIGIKYCKKKEYEAAHLVALDGRLTEEVKEEIIGQLEKAYFRRDKIDLKGPAIAATRGEIIEVSLQYLQGPRKFSICLVATRKEITTTPLRL